MTSGETRADYEFIFRALAQHLGSEYNPTAQIADASDAITRGFANAFGENFTRVYRWAHTIRNIDKKPSLIQEPQMRSQVRKNILQLQLARTPADFELAKNLFLKKYTEQCTEFLQYFSNEWLHQRSGWYEGLLDRAPSTNNGLESMNAHIKSEGTFRERLPIANFMDFMFRQCKIWSEERDDTNVNCKRFSLLPTPNLVLQTSARNWIDGKPDVKFRRQTNYVHYFVSATGQPKLKEADICK